MVVHASYLGEVQIKGISFKGIVPGVWISLMFSGDGRNLARGMFYHADHMIAGISDEEIPLLVYRECKRAIEVLARTASQGGLSRWPSIS